jgi:hypothetical protein
MMRARLRQAAYNNAVWCDTVCRIHGTPGQFFPSIWLNRLATPPFYPNAVTLTDAHDQEAQLAGIHELLAARIPGAWAVKDSFCALDLVSLGFEMLFEAQWIYRPAALPVPSEARNAGAWQPVRDAAELEAWELAWSDSPVEDPAAPHQRLFLPQLLADQNVLVLAAYRKQRIVAGAIVNRSDGVVGLSNVFVPAESTATFWAGCVAAVRNHFPGLPLVGYETGEALAQAQALGFELLQPLRVWQTVTQPS